MKMLRNITKKQQSIARQPLGMRLKETMKKRLITLRLLMAISKKQNNMQDMLLQNMHKDPGLRKMKSWKMMKIHRATVKGKFLSAVKIKDFLKMTMPVYYAGIVIC